MGLTAEQLNHLLNFKGYGNPDGPVWFLGIEERCKKEDIERNIEARAQFTAVMDLAEALMRIYNFDLHTMTKSPTLTWTWMAKIMIWLGYADGYSISVEYVKTKLGRKDGKTFLTDLFPLPAPSIKEEDWPDFYRTVFPDRRTYKMSVLEHQQAKLRQLINEHDPHYIFAYGRLCEQHYKALLPVLKWQRMKDSSYRTRSSVIEVGTWGKTTMIITPFFARRNGLRTADAQMVIDYLRSRDTGKA